MRQNVPEHWGGSQRVPGVVMELTKRCVCVGVLTMSGGLIPPADAGGAAPVVLGAQRRALPFHDRVVLAALVVEVVARGVGALHARLSHAILADVIA